MKERFKGEGELPKKALDRGDVKLFLNELDKRMPTITLREFINHQYPFTADTKLVSTQPLKITIKDIGLAPYEIDIYGSIRILVVENTGKFMSGANKEKIPIRVSVGRYVTMEDALGRIAYLQAKNKLMNADSQVITMREYFNAYRKFYKYLAGVLAPEYGKALNELLKNVEFKSIPEKQ